MNTKLALMMSLVVLAIVALVMDSDGAVGRLASDGEPGEPALVENSPRGEAGNAEPVFGAYVADPSEAGAFKDTASAPSIPVYEYRDVHIEVPQQVVDPAVAAASEIR
ncbi:hypothetical protein [Qipengyuania sp. MTN3-11]|uniref:hypothetical protein n=1 Tax=Qipengyuania sp. MTN3-11 TaxID=3056557 RepID=UPI0036F2D6EE